MYSFMIIGMTGQGKSLFTKNLIKDKQSYVFDVNNEYKGIASEVNTSCDENNFISECEKKQNTYCVFEEATGFFNGKIPVRLKKLIIGKRHSGNNYLFLFHSIQDAPPALVRLCNFVVLFKTNDERKTVEKKYEKLYQPFIKLMNAPKYSKLIIKLIDQ